MQDCRGWRDRIAAKEHRQTGKLRPRHEAERDRLGPGDRPVKPGFDLGRRDHMLRHRACQLCRLAIGMAGVQGSNVRIGERLVLRELLRQPLDNRCARAPEHPEREAERPHVLAAQRFLVAQAIGLHRIERELRNVELHHLPAGERSVLKRVLRILCLGKIAGGELAFVGNDQSAWLEL